MRRAPTLAAAGALLVLVVLVVLVGTGSDRRQVTSNYVRPLAFVTDVPAGRRACQPGERVPADAGAVRLRVGTRGRPGPELDVRLTGGGPPLAGSLAGGWREGDVEIPVTRVQGARSDARLCVVNRGPGPVTVAGESAPLPLPGAARPQAASVGSRISRGRMRVEYLEPERSSWFGFAGTLADRVGTVRHAVPGGASLWLAAALALSAILGAVALVVREAER